MVDLVLEEVHEHVPHRLALDVPAALHVYEAVELVLALQALGEGDEPLVGLSLGGREGVDLGVRRLVLEDGEPLAHLLERVEVIPVHDEDVVQRPRIEGEEARSRGLVVCARQLRARAVQAQVGPGVVGGEASNEREGIHARTLSYPRKTAGVGEPPRKELQTGPRLASFCVTVLTIDASKEVPS